MSKVKTKDKILTAALKLFNEQGFSKVSSKSISEYIGISYGNLCYHYPKKETIIKKLYFNLQAEMGQQFQQLQKEIYGFDFMVKSLKMLLEVLQKYKFIVLDVASLSRQFPEIKEHAALQFAERRRTLTAMFQFLVKEGYMHEERIVGHYKMLIHSFLIVTNAWIIDAEIFHMSKSSDKDKVAYYLELLYSSLRPSLTKKGLKAFNEVYQGRH